MAWNDSDEIRILASGQVYIAPVGTALPTNPTSVLPSTWTGLGLLSEEGVSLNYAPSIEEFRAWQVRGVVRREVTGIDFTAAFEMLQWNEASLPFAFGGGTITEPSPGVYRYDFPVGSEALNERAMVIDGVDGDVHQRLVIPSGSVTEGVETTMQRGAMSTLPISFAALEIDGQSIASFLTDDDAAFAAGS